MSPIAFEGSPASSTTSTLTVPESALGKNVEGEVKTRSLDGYPLGLTVSRGAGEGELRPTAWAVIIAVPGVVVVVTLAKAYSCPAVTVTESGTEAMLVWDEVRNTVMLCSATVGRLDESERETTTAWYTPPSAGSFGGMIVRTTFAAGPGAFEVAAEAGRNSVVKSSSAATIASFVVFLNLYCL